MAITSGAGKEILYDKSVNDYNFVVERASWRSHSKFTDSLQKGSLRAAEYSISPNPNLDYVPVVKDIVNATRSKSVIEGTLGVIGSTLNASAYSRYEQVGGKIIYDTVYGTKQLRSTDKLVTQPYTNKDEKERVRLLHTKFAIGVDKNTSKKVFRLETGEKSFSLFKKVENIALQTTNAEIIKEAELLYSKLEKNQRSELNGKYIKTGTNIFPSILKDLSAAQGDVIIASAEIDLEERRNG